MTFSKQEMISALERLGYEIKVETESVVEEPYKNYEEKREYNVYNVYKDGVKYCEYSGYGLRRVQVVFETELKKRILHLFAVD
jgi:hypothetical protein